MEKIRKVMIVGLGALGTLYADAFQKTEDTEVFVLVDEDRKDRYEKNPHILNGKECSFTYVLPVDNVSEGSAAKQSDVSEQSAGSNPGPMDLILVCTKSNGMRQAINMIQGYVGEETIIASLMNGVSFEELAAERYGMEHIIYMVYMGDGVKNMNGEVYDTNINNLFFGSLGNPGDDEQVALIDEFFSRAGIGYGVKEDMLYAYWRKCILIDSFNQACAVFGTDYSVFHNVPEAMTLAKGLLAECIPVAKAAGVNNADEFMDDIIGAATGIAPDCMPSITQDRLMNRRMEVDILADEIIKRSRQLGLETPYNDMVSLILNVINKQNGFTE